MRKRWIATLVILSAVTFGFWLGRVSNSHVEAAAKADAAPRVFEIRTYTANEGKLDALQARFRDHTVKLFANHGMTNVGYWTPADAPLSQNTLIYILAHANREAAKQNWEAFRNDPEWKKVQSESEANGKLVSKVESVFLEATDYSPMK